MKVYATFAVFAVSLFLFAFTLGLGFGEWSSRLVEAVYAYTYGIWIPAGVLALVIPCLAYAVYSDRVERAEKFRFWCIAKLSFSSELKEHIAYLDAIIIAFDVGVIRREDVLSIFHSAAPSQAGQDRLRAELADRIQYRLQSGNWKLNEADANRRRLIEAFGYFKSPNQA